MGNGKPTKTTAPRLTRVNDARGSGARPGVAGPTPAAFLDLVQARDHVLRLCVSPLALPTGTKARCSTTGTHRLLTPLSSTPPASPKSGGAENSIFNPALEHPKPGQKSKFRPTTPSTTFSADAFVCCIQKNNTNNKSITFCFLFPSPSLMLTLS